MRRSKILSSTPQKGQGVENDAQLKVPVSGHVLLPVTSVPGPWRLHVERNKRPEIQLPGLDPAGLGLTAPRGRAAPHSIWPLHLSGLGSVPPQQRQVILSVCLPGALARPGLGRPLQFWNMAPYPTSAPLLPHPRPSTHPDPAPRAWCKFLSSLLSLPHAVSHT